ncbi:putative carbonic anhydrase-like protein 2 [Penaeus vannamei]|uniref:Putative carbonic anhydrase-like protein 2 n=1 Tax=Penaeus vannamei TaxID=6689 RepID=A0A423T5G0_PENVA|nr:putative carbonic anhydrase-like protein 2 [Penaeus vannamei]
MQGGVHPALGFPAAPSQLFSAGFMGRPPPRHVGKRPRPILCVWAAQSPSSDGVGVESNVKQIDLLPSSHPLLFLLPQVSTQGNPELRILTDAMEKIRYAGSWAPVERLSVRGLLPSTENYMTYEGSLTQPPCHETVTWVVLNKPIYITKQQVRLMDTAVGVG